MSAAPASTDPAEQARIDARVAAWLPFAREVSRRHPTTAWAHDAGSGVDTDWLMRRTGISVPDVEAALGRLVAAGRAVEAPAGHNRRHRVYFAAPRPPRPPRGVLHQPDARSARAGR